MPSISMKATTNNAKGKRFKSLNRHWLIGAVCVFLLQWPVIWYFAPVASDFERTQKLEGTYSYESGGKGRSSTYVGKRSLHCSISFMGGDFGCGHTNLDGKSVVVELARFKHLFGTGERVVSVATGEHVEFAYSPTQIIDAWWSMSFWEAIRNAVLLTGLVVVVYVGILEFNENK